MAVSHTGRASGAEAVLLRLLGGAAEQGWHVTCATPPGPLAHRVRQAGVDHLAIPELTLPDGPRPVAAAVLAARTVAAAGALRRAGANADLVVSNGLLALPALRLARLPAPVAWIVHDVITRPDRLAVLRRCASAVDLAIPVSESAAEPAKACGIAVRVVRNGTPWPVAPAAVEPRQPPVVGCSALLTSWKGQDVLLEAVARMARSDVIVELMGGRFPKDGAFVAALERRAARSDLAGRVRFLGYVEEPLQRMRHWTVAVSASVEPEAGPLALIEAMSLGVPVVGTDLGGSPEVVGDAGLLVPVRDPSALAAAVERLVDEPGLRRRCAEAGPRLVATGLTLDAQLRALLDVLAGLARPSPRRRSAASPPVARATALRSGGVPDGSVVFVVPDFEPAPGGTVRQAGTQARALARRGHPVVVVTRRMDRRWPRRQVLDGLAVIRLGRPGRGRLPEKLSVLAMAVWLRRHRRRVGIVQIVMYADFALSAWAAGLLRSTVLTWASRGDPTDALARGSGPARRLQWQLRRHVLARCTHVALTAAIARELTDLGAGPTIETIPVPVDPSRFRAPSPGEREAARHRLGVDDDRLVIVYAGHLRALKCVDRLVEAFGRFRATGRPGHLLLVGGDRGAVDDREEELRAAVSAAGLDAEVTFAGVVDDVAPQLWAGDVFVLPSSREGLPNSLLEAMACGLACVAPPSAGGDEVLVGGTGMVPPDNRPAELCRALVALADDPRRRRALGRAAAARSQAFGVEGVAADYERLYARLRQPQPSRRRGADIPPPGGGGGGPSPSGAARLAGAAGALRVLAGGGLRTPGGIVLAYHDVGDDPSNTTDYYVSTALLRAQLTAAVEWGLRFVDLAELTGAVVDGAPLDGLAAVVFDDSLVGVHHHAMPVLVDLGLPATVFVVSDALGSSPAWWPGAARVMTRAEVVEMADAGFGIGSHTRTHPSLPSLSPSAVDEELAGSRRALQDLVGGPVDLFAYPFGHHDAAVREAVAEAGYRAGYSFLNGRVTAGLDRYRLPRLNMWRGQDRARLAYHLARPPASWPPTQLDTVLHRDPPLPSLLQGRRLRRGLLGGGT